MKVALLTGPCPPGECGVGDYTACLGNALKASGVDTHVIASGDWNLLSVLGSSRLLKKQNFDIVHIEYPTVGFRYSLGPQALSLLRACVITIHEASQRHVLRKLALIPFAVRPKHVIFTSNPERLFATKWAPWIARSSSVIPVGSNIPVAEKESPRTPSEIVYFGLLVPRKEIEQVLELASRIHSAGARLLVRIIGRVPVKHVAYFEQLRLKTEGLPIIWDHDLSEECIAQRLAGASIAYLPYTDGASERRTTLQAALLSGLAVITTRGPHTPQGLAQVVKFCRTPEDALATILSLIENSQETSRLSANAVKYAQQYTWEHIAKLHLEVYHAVLGKKPNIIPAEGRKVLG